jgi:RHS repeat-associated protein
VTINGEGASISSWTDTSIGAVVPAGATVGAGTVTVNTAGTPSNAVAFTVETGPPVPVITSLSRTWGPPGTWVTVTGSGFGASRGTSKVKFNGVNAAAYDGWSDTLITAKVSSSATTGLVKVLKKPESVLSNGLPFTVGTEEVRYHHTDGIGSVRMVTGHEGHVWERHDYQPFGVEMPPVTGEERIRFAGKEHDPETGASGWTALDYFGARYLHSATGRFTSVDPLMRHGPEYRGPAELEPLPLRS